MSLCVTENWSCPGLVPNQELCISIYVFQFIFNFRCINILLHAVQPHFRVLQDFQHNCQRRLTEKDWNVIYNVKTYLQILHKMILSLPSSIRRNRRCFRSVSCQRSWLVLSFQWTDVIYLAILKNGFVVDHRAPVTHAMLPHATIYLNVLLNTV